jgi:hypothetical protein
VQGLARPDTLSSAEHSNVHGQVKRAAFKELVAANKRYRKRTGMIVPRITSVKPLPPNEITTSFKPDYTEVLKGDDVEVGTYPDGFPILPACLRRAPMLKLVVDNKPTDTTKEEAA